MNNPRNRMYIALAIAHRWAADSLPEFREDDYRDILRRYGAKEVNGKYSAKTLSIGQLYQVEDHFKKLGFKKRHKPAAGQSPRIKKLNAMWCALADGGHVNDRSESAMESWCKNNVPRFTQLRWATGDQLNKAIEMLKRWAAREDVLDN